jgi:hypothetical protein
MGIANSLRASLARAQSAPGARVSLRNRGPLRPYTQFAQGGIHRYRRAEPEARLFRVK